MEVCGHSHVESPGRKPAPPTPRAGQSLAVCLLLSNQKPAIHLWAEEEKTGTWFTHCPIHCAGTQKWTAATLQPLCGLNKNGPHKLLYLNACGMPLFEKIKTCGLVGVTMALVV